MKLYGFAFALLLFQQQSCDQAMLSRGRDGVAEGIQSKLMPKVRDYFPESQWIPSGDTRVILIDTGVSGVTTKFLGKLQQPLAEELVVIQQERNSLGGIYATAVGAFPQVLSFNFNLSGCTSLPSIALTYNVANAQMEIARASLPSSPCVSPVAIPGTPEPTPVPYLPLPPLPERVQAGQR